MDLRGAVGVVTGGGSGIGRATCLALASRGAVPAVWDVDAQAAEAAVIEVRATGAHAVAVPVDVGDPDAVAAATTRTVDEFGRLDVLVANAAVGAYGPIVDVTDEAWRRIMRVDLDGVFWCVREAARVMRGRGGGRIVLVSSRDGLRPEPGMVAYGVAKAGVVHLARVAAAELGRDGITVNVVCPGPTDTPMLDQTRAVPGLHETVSAQPALGRLGRPEEVADAIVFCASHDWMTGAVLSVDGGSWLGGDLGIRDAVERLTLSGD